MDPRCQSLTTLSIGRAPGARSSTIAWACQFGEPVLRPIAASAAPYHLAHLDECVRAVRKSALATCPSSCDRELRATAGSPLGPLVVVELGIEQIHGRLGSEPARYRTPILLHAACVCRSLHPRSGWRPFLPTRRPTHCPAVAILASPNSSALIWLVWAGIHLTVMLSTPTSFALAQICCHTLEYKEKASVQCASLESRPCTGSCNRCGRLLLQVQCAA